MKVLFLDIDGVLNSRSWADRHGYGWNWRFDPAALEQLERVIATTGAWIVVSSAWRVGRKRTELLQAFADGGMSRELRARVIAVTPNLPNDAAGNHYRGEEITAWLKSHEAVVSRNGLIGPVEVYAIVDDGDDMTVHMARLAQTDWAIGLTSVEADKLIALLSEPVAAQESIDVLGEGATPR